MNRQTMSRRICRHALFAAVSLAAAALGCVADKSNDSFPMAVAYGTATDATGKPITGFVVAFQGLGASCDGPALHTDSMTVTNERGAYRLVTVDMQRGLGCSRLLFRTLSPGERLKTIERPPLPFSMHFPLDSIRLDVQF